MPHDNRTFILAYVLLVGLPLIALVGVLKNGRKLTAPVSVDGVWQLKADPAALASLPCGKSLAEAPDTALAISQSGKNFTLSLSNDPKSAGAGVLSGTALQASLVPSAGWAAEAGCGNGRELALIATVDPNVEPRSLLGRLSVNNCPSCGSVEFRASRQAPPIRKGSH